VRRTFALLLVALLATVLVACSSEEDPSSGPADDGPEGTQIVRATGREHVDGAVDYPTSPPAGGNHNERWLNCGFRTEPVPDELAVHSMEHGAVWVAYSDEVPEEELALLQQRAEQEDYLLVTPYEGLDSPLVLTAWERQLELDSISDPRFAEFLDAYLQGPTTPEPGAPCKTGGVD
jgi:hypothetical protein